jgi:hypothetical protein
MDPFEATAMNVNRDLKLELRNKIEHILQQNNRISETKAMELITLKLNAIVLNDTCKNSNMADRSIKASLIAEIRLNLSNYSAGLEKIEKSINVPSDSAEYLGPSTMTVANRLFLGRVMEELCAWGSNVADYFRNAENDIRTNLDSIKRDTNELSALLSARNMLLDQQTKSNQWAENEIKDRIKQENDAYNEESKRRDNEIGRYESMLKDVMAMHQAAVLKLREKQDKLRKRLEEEREAVLEEQRKLGNDTNKLKVDTRAADRQRLLEQEQLEESLSKQQAHIKDLRRELDQLGDEHAIKVRDKTLQFFADISKEEESIKKEKEALIAQLNDDQRKDDAVKAAELQKLKDMINNKETSVTKLENGETLDSPDRFTPTAAANRNQSTKVNKGGKKKQGDQCRQS